LLANMEQWRWMPADMGETYINVNIPEFMVRIVQNGKVTFEERVVAGQTDKQTPVFSDELETLYFHPRWNVPESIKVLELYPSLARGGGSFQRQGLKLVRNGKEISPSSVDWGSADIRNFDVYQPSGDRNVLGLVKFVFPNKHGVYLHDTTAKALFDEPSRPFSHGCMRVRNPLRFAEALLAIDKQWPASSVTDIIEREPDETAVQVDKKIPIHVTYFTNVIGEDGEEQIFKDVYGHEQRIKLALAGKFDQIAVGGDHLAPVEFKRVRYAQSPDDFGSFFGFGSNSSTSSSSSNSGGGETSLGDFFNNVFGGGYSPPAKQQKRKRGPANKVN
jgi:L,D-transpeptidase YcbB